MITALCVSVGLMYYLVRPQEDTYEATATIVIQEPVRSVENAAGQGASERYLQSQLEILRSPVVSETAAQALTDEGLSLDGDQVAERVRIAANPDSPLVTITSEAETPEAAIALVNGLADAYREVSQRQASATAEAQLSRIDAQVTAIDERLAEIDEELSGMVAGDDDLARLREQADAAVAEIAALQASLADATLDEREVIRARIEDLRGAITIYAEVRDSAVVGPEAEALIQEQTSQVERRATLLTLRDEVAVDAGIAPDSIALVQQAEAAEPISGLGLSRIVAVALIVGLALGVAAAYFQSVWRRTFATRSEPEEVLAAPLLADVPDFETERIKSPLPVRDHPRSAAAEAFRFAAASAMAAARSRGSRSIFVASATLGHGKTTTAVNTALAAAIHGRSVLLLDCDFGNQEASRLLLGPEAQRLDGFTDVVEGIATTSEALHIVDLGDGIPLSVMPRGTRPSLAAAVLQSPRAATLLGSLVDEFELVLIDGPPVLQVAYGSTLAQLADAVMVVVEHEGSYAQLADLRHRLELVGTPVLGYVYNRSPLRREMTASEGSMMDILGDYGVPSQPTPLGRGDKRR